MDYQYKLNYPLIARRIKAARKMAGLTQAELAERIDISTNAVAKLENDLMAPSLQTLVNAANVLGIDFNDLLREESGRSTQDAFLDSQFRALSTRDKEFVLHIIKGLKLYR